MDIVTAHRLASFIEMVHAKDRASLRRAARNYRPKWQDEYDALAATCLGDLIYETAHRARGSVPSDRSVPIASPSKENNDA